MRSARLEASLAASRPRLRSPSVALGVAFAVTCAALVYDPLAEAAEPKRVLGLVLACVGLSLWIAQGTPALLLGPGARCAFGFWALGGLSLCWGFPAGALDLGTWCAALGTALIGAQLGPRLARRAAQLAALKIGGISALLAIISAFAGLSGMRLHGGQGNPNWLGLLLAVTLPVSIDAALAWRRAPIVWRAGALVATALQIPALYLSHSRVAWIAAGSACSVLLAFAGRTRALARKRRRMPRRARLAIATMLAAATLAIGAVRAAPVGHDVPADIALGGRVWIWRAALDAARVTQPFGAGLGRFAALYLDAQGERLRTMTPPQAARRFINATTAHDEYLQVAIESGGLAALALLGALLFGARDHARTRFFGGTGALLACALASLGDSPIRLPAITLLLGLLLGVPGTSAGKLLAPATVTAGGATLAWRVAGFGVLVVSAWLLLAATRGWLGTRVRTHALDSNPIARLGQLKRSVALDPASGEALLDLGLAELERGNARGALTTLERADRLLSDTSTRLAIGAAELAIGDAAGAERAFRRALAWNPGSFRGRLGLAEALRREQHLSDAERDAQLAHQLLPGDPRARELLDAIREAQMDR